MTLMVWRAPRGQMLAECTKCGSRGSTHVEVKTVEDEGRRSAMSAHHARARDLRVSFEADLNALVRQQQTGALTRKAASEAAKARMAKHHEDISDILDKMPPPGNGVRDVVEKCPWCGAAETVVVRVLPDDVAEPPEWVGSMGRKKS